MSSSYDAALVDTAMIEDPRMLRLSRSDRLLYVELVVWAKLRRTDGHIPLAALPRVTDEPSPVEAAGRLEVVGLLRTDQAVGGFWISDVGATQMSKAQVERKVQLARAARDRYEERHPDRPRRGKRTDVSREPSVDASDSLPDRPPARAEQVGSRTADGTALEGEPSPLEDSEPGPIPLRRCPDCGLYFNEREGHECPKVPASETGEGRYLRAVEGGR